MWGYRLRLRSPQRWLAQVRVAEARMAAPEAVHPAEAAMAGKSNAASSVDGRQLPQRSRRFPQRRQRLLPDSRSRSCCRTNSCSCHSRPCSRRNPRSRNQTGSCSRNRYPRSRPRRRNRANPPPPARRQPLLRSHVQPDGDPSRLGGTRQSGLGGFRQSGLGGIRQGESYTPTGNTIEERLANIGVTLLNEALTSEVVDLARLAIAEARRFPDLGSSIIKMARERGAETTARLLSEAAQSGELGTLPAFSPASLATTARYFQDLILLPMLMRALSGEDLEALRAEIGPHVLQTVAFFLAACRNGGIT
jgi:hypothetical protein